MPQFERMKPSIDTTIDNIPEGKSNIKIIGMILTKNGGNLIIGDATGQIPVNNYKLTRELLTKQKARITLAVTKHDNELNAEIISFQSMTDHQIDLYTRILELEKRIPK